MHSATTEPTNHEVFRPSLPMPHNASRRLAAMVKIDWPISHTNTVIVAVPESSHQYVAVTNNMQRNAPPRTKEDNGPLVSCLARWNGPSSHGHTKKPTMKIGENQIKSVSGRVPIHPGALHSGPLLMTTRPPNANTIMPSTGHQAFGTDATIKPTISPPSGNAHVSMRKSLDSKNHVPTMARKTK